MAVLVSPYEWEWQTVSTVASALFVSNVYFLSKQGYFDIDMYEKALLHTWSLSVEEQFYLIGPILLIGCYLVSRRFGWRPTVAVRALAALIAAASLAGCIAYTSPVDRNPGFYLTPWRAWEFVAGAAAGPLALWLAVPARRWLREAAGLAGAALIAAAMIVNADNADYPSIHALLPVAGALLIIAAGLADPRGLVARLLSLRMAVAIGLVSYGWYLWHWPLIALARSAQFGDPSLVRDVAMAIVSLLLAVLTWHWVERPARRWRERHDLSIVGGRVVGAGVVASLAVALVCGGIGGAAYALGLRNSALTADVAPFSQASECPPSVCSERTGVKGVLVGDSHADRVATVLSREAGRLGIALERNAVPPDAEFVIYVRRWAPHFLARPATDPDGGFAAEVESNVVGMSDGGRRRVLLVGPVPEFDYSGVECVLRADRYGMDRDVCALPRTSVELRRAGAVSVLKRLAAETPNARYFDPLDLFCDAELCRPVKDGVILMKDDNHLTTPYGAERLLAYGREAFWWVFSGGMPGPSTQPAG